MFLKINQTSVSKAVGLPLLHYNVCLKESSSSSIAHLHLYTERVKSRDSETV